MIWALAAVCVGGGLVFYSVATLIESGQWPWEK